jgi:hypothetical protein
MRQGLILLAPTRASDMTISSGGICEVGEDTSVRRCHSLVMTTKNGFVVDLSA